MFTYDRNIVLAVYRTQHPDVLEPDDSVIEKLDSNLVEMYDAVVRSQAAAAGITINPFAISTLVFYAAQSRAKGVDTRVRHAIKFFQKVKPHGPVV